MITQIEEKDYTDEMAPMGFKPMFSPWEGDVLDQARRWGHVEAARAGIVRERPKGQSREALMGSCSSPCGLWREQCGDDIVKPRMLFLLVVTLPKGGFDFTYQSRALLSRQFFVENCHVNELQKHVTDPMPGQPLLLLFRENRLHGRPPDT